MTTSNSQDILDDIILKGFIEFHGFDVSGTDPEMLKALVRYAKSIGYSDGYDDRKATEMSVHQSISAFKMTLNMKIMALLNSNIDRILSIHLTSHTENRKELAKMFSSGWFQGLWQLKSMITRM